MSNEQNIQDGAQEPTIQTPNIMKMKQLEKIQNNRYLNQNIYQLFVVGRYIQCLELIDKCKPDEYKLYIKSLIYKNQFKLEKSLNLLKQCQVMNKLNFTYLKGLAKNFFLLGRYQSSLGAAKEAYQLNTADYEISYIMAKISLATKDIEDAITNLGRSISKEPNEQSYILLAKLLIQKGEYQQAAQELKKAISISPQNDQIFEMLGVIYGKIGQKADSLKYYEMSLDINPNRYEAIFATSALKQAQGEIDVALQQYTKAYKFTQNSAIFWNNIASIMLQKNKEIVAYCCLKKALFLDPFRWDIHANLGLILIKIKKYVGAQMHIRSALKLKKDPYLYNLLAICLVQLGDLNNAQKCYEEILKISKESKYQINYLCLLVKKGDKGQNPKYKQILNQLNQENLSAIEKDKLKQLKEIF